MCLSSKLSFEEKQNIFAFIVHIYVILSLHLQIASPVTLVSFPSPSSSNHLQNRQSIGHSVHHKF